MFRIGELAKACGVKPDTLRFYEKSGLLIPSMRSETGYRLYNAQDKNILMFILRAKKVGFNLSEIEALLAIDIDKTASSCAEVKEFVDTKLIDVKQKIEELNQFKTSLERLSNACCGGIQSAESCTILQALESDIEQVTPEHHHQI